MLFFITFMLALEIDNPYVFQILVPMTFLGIFYGIKKDIRENTYYEGTYAVLQPEGTITSEVPLTIIVIQPDSTITLASE